MILQHVRCGQEDTQDVLQGGMSGFKHDLSYTMTGTQTSHAISIQVKSVLKETSCEASDASVPRDWFCRHGTGEGSDGICEDECDKECHDNHHDSHHDSQHDGRFHRLGQWHCSVRLGIGALPCLSLFAFMMNKASSNRNCTSYIHPELQKQQEIITSLKPNDWSEN